MSDEPVEHQPDLRSFFVGDGLVRQELRRLESNQALAGRTGEIEPSPAAGAANDRAFRRIEERSLALQRPTAAPPTDLELGRETELADETRLERQEERFAATLVSSERREKGGGQREDGGYRLPRRERFAKELERGAAARHTAQACEDRRKGLDDRGFGQSPELPTSDRQLDGDHAVGLEGTAESLPTLPGPPGQRRDLPEVVGQERDDAIGLPVVDGTEEECVGAGSRSRHGAFQDSSMGVSR